ncbi:MAG: hemerythrin domain-containing protein [Acidobacteriota bacterium]
MTTTDSKKTNKSSSVADIDAISILKSDHKKVTDLFDKFEKTKEGGSSREKGSLVKTICSELLVHAAIEEEIFYPAVRKEIHEDDLMNEARVEHAGAKDLIHQLEHMHPDDEMFDAKVKVLSEYIRHHVKEEQDEMFPKVRKTEMDLEALGSKMLKMKKKLMEHGESPSQPKQRAHA